MHHTYITMSELTFWLLFCYLTVTICWELKLWDTKNFNFIYSWSERLCLAFCPLDWDECQASALLLEMEQLSEPCGWNIYAAPPSWIYGGCNFMCWGPENTCSSYCSISMQPLFSGMFILTEVLLKTDLLSLVSLTFLDLCQHVSKFLWDYTALHPRRQSSLFILYCDIGGGWAHFSSLQKI